MSESDETNPPPVRLGYRSSQSKPTQNYVANTWMGFGMVLLVSGFIAAQALFVLKRTPVEEKELPYIVVNTLFELLTGTAAIMGGWALSKQSSSAKPILQTVSWGMIVYAIAVEAYAIAMFIRGDDRADHKLLAITLGTMVFVAIPAWTLITGAHKQIHPPHL